MPATTTTNPMLPGFDAATSPEDPGAERYPFAYRMRAAKGSPWRVEDIRLKRDRGGEWVAEALVRDGLAIHPALWAWEEKEPAFVMTHVAAGSGFLPALDRDLKKMLRCGDVVVTHPDWPLVRDLRSHEDVGPEERAALDAINSAAGEFMGWPLGWPRPLPPMPEPRDLAEALAAFASARRSKLGIGWMDLPGDLNARINRDYRVAMEHLEWRLGRDGSAEFEGKTYRTDGAGRLVTDGLGAAYG